MTLVILQAQMDTMIIKMKTIIKTLVMIYDDDGNNADCAAHDVDVG